MSERKNPDGSVSVGILEDMEVETKVETRIEPKAEKEIPEEKENAPKKKGRPKK